MFPELTILLICNQRIRNITESLLNCPLIGQHQLLLTSFAQPHTGLDSAASKNGLRQRSAEAPQSGRSSEQACKSRTLKSAVRGQCDLGKVSCLSYSDLSVRRHQFSFGRPNIWPSLEQAGWYSRGNLWKMRLFGQLHSTRNGARIVTQQRANEIFFLLDLPLQIRDGFSGNGNQLFRLAHIQHRAGSAVGQCASKLERFLARNKCTSRNVKLKIQRAELKI